MKNHKHWCRRIGAAGLTLILASALAACASNGDTSASAGGSCDATGVSDSEIQVGAITALSGAVSPAYLPFAAGATARMEAQNAEGGVNGRTIVLSVSDDASDPSRNLAAARELVEGREVIGVIEGSSFTGGGADYLLRQNLAVTGYPSTTEFLTVPNFIGYANTSLSIAVSDSTNRLWGQYMMDEGGTKAYGLASGTPSSVLSARAIVLSAEAAGMAAGVVTTDLPIGTTNYTGEVEKVRATGVDALGLSTAPAQTLAFMAALRQAGITPKVSLLFAGYDPNVVRDNPSLEGSTFVVPFTPFEVNLPAHQKFFAAMKAYAPDGRTDQFAMAGWLSADLMLKGISDAGACPSRESVLASIRALKGFTADGLIPPTDFAEELHGKPTPCAYFVKVRNGQFVPDNGGQPTCIADTGLVPVS